jgi:DNA-directed RNA polymerase subunit RPC12/RpoP
MKFEKYLQEEYLNEATKSSFNCRQCRGVTKQPWITGQGKEAQIICATCKKNLPEKFPDARKAVFKCSKCGKKTSTLYNDMKGNPSYCKDCA